LTWDIIYAKDSKKICILQNTVVIKYMFFNFWKFSPM